MITSLRFAADAPGRGSAAGIQKASEFVWQTRARECDWVPTFASQGSGPHHVRDRNASEQMSRSARWRNPATPPLVRQSAAQLSKPPTEFIPTVRLSEQRKSSVDIERRRR